MPKMTMAKRLWTYGLLAVLAYAVGFGWGSGPGFAVFVTGGVVFELAFWVALFRGLSERRAR